MFPGGLLPDEFTGLFRHLFLFFSNYIIVCCVSQINTLTLKDIGIFVKIDLIA